MNKPLTKRFLLQRVCVLSLLAIVANGAQALEYRSTARHGVILFDAPQDTASKRFVLSANMPLEVLSEQADWLRVRDRDGTLSWIKKSDVSPRRFVQLSRNSKIFQAANNKSHVLYSAERNVLLELQENTGAGWLKVKHRDGAIGYIRIEDVWGA